MKWGRVSFYFETIAFYSLCFFWFALTFSGALTEISFAVALVSWVIARNRRLLTGGGILPKSLVLPLAGYVVLSVLSYFWSEYPAQSFRGIFKVLQQVGVFIMTADLFQEPARRKRFEIFFVLTFVIVLLDAYYQFQTGRDLLRGFEAQKWAGSVRLTGSFGIYGKLAAYLITVIPFFILSFFYFLKSKKDSLKIGFYGLASLGGIVLLYWTRSRGAMLAFLGGMLFLMILKRKFLFLTLAALFFAGSLFFLPKEVLFHMDSRGKEQSVVERLYLWDRAVSVIKAKPWSGTGINTYAAAHAKYDKTGNWRVRNYYAHNGYLQVAAETGIFSLFFLLFFWFRYGVLSLQRNALFSSDRSRQEFLSREKTGAYGLGLLAGVINFLLFTTVDTVFHSPQPVMTFWFVAGLQWGSAAWLKREYSALTP